MFEAKSTDSFDGSAGNYATPAGCKREAVKKGYRPGAAPSQVIDGLMQTYLISHPRMPQAKDLS